MKLRPTRGKLFVKIDEPEQTGLIKLSVPRSCYGTVTASAVDFYPVGSRVKFGANGGTELFVDDLWVFFEAEIIAKVS